MKLPEVLNKVSTDQLFIDATPDGNYVLRVLEHFRLRCNEVWATGTDGSCDNPIWALMNDTQVKRAAELDRSINFLRSKLQKPADNLADELLVQAFQDHASEISFDDEMNDE